MIFLETLPQTFVGLRAGVSLALVVIVVAEMFIGGIDGMGHRIMDDQMSYNLKDMYGSLIVSGRVRLRPELCVPADRTIFRALGGPLK